MNKENFLRELKEALAGLPQDDVEERLSFYREMIDDRMEEGIEEKDAVVSLGSIETIVSQILAETPITKIVKEKIKPKRRLAAWEIVLIILGFPLWFPLLIAAGAVVFSLYVVVWSLILSLWAVELSFCACALGGIGGIVVCFIQGNWLFGVASLGIGLFSAGVSILLFFGCVAASKGLLKLTKKAVLGVKSRLIRKENAK